MREVSIFTDEGSSSSWNSSEAFCVGRCTERPFGYEFGGTVGKVCGWYSIWGGLAVASEFVLVWKGMLLVLLNEKVSAFFKGAQ